LARQKFSYATDSAQRVPGILFELPGPKTRRPAVIALHGTGGKKENELPLLIELARIGFVAIAIDGRYHGARTAAGNGAREYDEAIARSFQSGAGHPLYYDTVWDVMRLIDYLETRTEVDARRIGLIGFSKGGVETYLAAASDPRIAVAVPCIGMQSFRWELEHNDWQTRVSTFQPAFDAAAKEAGARPMSVAFVRAFYDRVVPGIYGRFDGPEMIRLIAPRPLLLINGDSDEHTPLASVRECAAAAREAYGAAGAVEKFVLRIEPHTGHHVNPPDLMAAENWLVKWLKP
jgi:dienelactone hydrolase